MNDHTSARRDDCLEKSLIYVSIIKIIYTYLELYQQMMLMEDTYTIMDLPKELQLFISDLILGDNKNDPKSLVPFMCSCKHFYYLFRPSVYKSIRIITTQDDFYGHNYYDCDEMEILERQKLQPSYGHVTLVTKFSAAYKLVRTLTQNKELCELLEDFHITAINFDFGASSDEASNIQKVLEYFLAKGDRVPEDELKKEKRRQHVLAKQEKSGILSEKTPEEEKEERERKPLFEPGTKIQFSKLQTQSSFHHFKNLEKSLGDCYQTALMDFLVHPKIIEELEIPGTRFAKKVREFRTIPEIQHMQESNGTFQRINNQIYPIWNGHDARDQTLNMSFTPLTTTGPRSGYSLYKIIQMGLQLIEKFRFEGNSVDILNCTMAQEMVNTRHNAEKLSFMTYLHTRYHYWWSK